MQIMTPPQVADFLETAAIEFSHDAGHAIVHSGVSEAGHRFVLVADCYGSAALTQSL